MRIAFVGKGGSGKTTLTALFSDFISKKHQTLVVDGDLNMHIAPLLGLENPRNPEGLISHPQATKIIKAYLRGNNNRIRDLVHFRKTTPPTRESQFVVIGDKNNPILNHFGSWKENLCLLVVGAYETEEIGTGCYHNNLAIFENILSHLIDKDGVCVSDMVAGIDAFANTLHAQFDMLVLVVEPTRRGVEVYKQYKDLAQEAGVMEHLFVVGNKVKNDSDREFLKALIPPERLIGFFEDSDYLRHKDQEGGSLNVDQLEEQNKDLLRVIESKLFSIQPNHQARLMKLFDLHRKYVGQGSITERFGDLTNHIDPDFNLELFMREIDKKRPDR